ncbi:MAG: outer membrane beta-barrel protein [Bacteroidales bacterium]
MKKTGLIVAFLLMIFATQAQIITDKNSKKYTIGFDMYTDFVTKYPADYNPATFNPGFNVYGTYNFPVGKSPHIFALGVGISTHNLYSNTKIADLNADTIDFDPITFNYKRSKINLTYLDVPAELRLKFKHNIKIGIGFKMSILIDSKEKYIGDKSITGPRVYVKNKRINSLETYTFGPTLRVGYKWVSLFGYYQIGRTFNSTRGPEFSPVSVGLSISPF